MYEHFPGLLLPVNTGFGISGQVFVFCCLCCAERFGPVINPVSSVEITEYLRVESGIKDIE